MLFLNRSQAGKELAEKLDQFLSSKGAPIKRSNLLVVGLPRGGVPVALEVARKFGCSLEIIVAKKLPFPGQPEYAIGAVSSDGVVILNPDIPQDKEWNFYIEQQREALLKSTVEIEKEFYELAGCTKSSFQDKTVIVVDDGIATGMTAIAALESAHLRGAEHTIIAAPVMGAEIYDRLRSHCDCVVAVSVPQEFRAVGQFYLNFDQTTNEEVVSALRESSGFGLHLESTFENHELKTVGG
jgi:putative phosphoribosyl transferase